MCSFAREEAAAGGGRCCSRATATCTRRWTSTRRLDLQGRQPQEVGPQQVRERYGVDPAQVPDLIALRGDPSDGLPGAPGIGAKTAAALLSDYGSLEGALRARRDARTHRRRGS